MSQCEKCGTKNVMWKQGVTYEGLDKHHNPPEEISRFLKEKWNGDFIILCRKCHERLHKNITQILKKYSMQPKYNSDYWLMMKSTPKKIKEAQKEIFSFTQKWMKEENENTKTITGSQL